jgi:YD repeat-containing protein
MKIIFCLLLISHAYAAEPQRSYDASGHFLGRAERQGNVTRYYDKDGKFVGRDDNQNGRVILHYDAEGHYLGRDTR